MFITTLACADIQKILRSTLVLQVPLNFFPASHKNVASRVTFCPAAPIIQSDVETQETPLSALESGLDERMRIAAAQDEPARFAELYEQNFDRVYAFFAHRVASRQEAEDLTSEVFHQALASIRNFKWQGAPFVSWLYGIAAHVLSAHRRRLGHSQPLEDDLSDSGPDIERSVLLSKLVQSLADDQRHVIQRRFVDQRSIREIAQELGRSEGAIKQLQLRALENLRTRLGSKL